MGKKMIKKNEKKEENGKKKKKIGKKMEKRKTPEKREEIPTSGCECTQPREFRSLTVRAASGSSTTSNNN
jgi:hypothetical protein